MKILVVEDNPVSSRLLKAQLEAEGHTVLTAADGVEGYKMLEHDSTMELIIADARMPRIDGYELLSLTRCSALHKDTPFILYSSFDTHISSETMAYELGANRYVRKTGHAIDILNAVNTLSH